MKMKYTGAVFASVFFCVCAVFAQTNDLQPLAMIKIAKTPESVTVRDVKKRVEVYEKQLGDVLPVAQRKEVLDSLIDEKLVVQAAQKAGLAITDAQVNQYFIQNISQQMGRAVTEQEFAAFIKQNTGKSLDDYIREQVGMNVSEYKSSLKNQLIAQQYIMREKQSEINKVAATDKEIRDYYSLNQSAFARNEALKLFLVITKKGTDIAASRKRITDVYGELKSKPGTYDAISKRYVNDADMKAGDIYVSRTPQAAQQLGISIDNLGQLFGREIGFISEVTETPTDFQFYVVREHLDAKMLKLDDEVQPESATTVYEFIRGGITQDKQTAYLASAIKEVTTSLRTAQNYEMLKTGDALDKLLAW